MSFADFLFASPFIPAAFFVAGIACMFKFQFQALIYFLAVVYAVETDAQFMFISFLFSVQIILSGLYRSASDDR